MKALAQTVLAWLLASSCSASLVWRGSGLRWGEVAPLLAGHTVLAWRAALVTLAVLLAVVGCAWSWRRSATCSAPTRSGQDVLTTWRSRVRTALVIGTWTTLVMMPFAVALGIAAATSAAGWMMPCSMALTVLNAIPGVLLIAAAVLMMQVVIDTRTGSTPQPSARTRACWHCTSSSSASPAGQAWRLLRGETAALRELEYAWRRAPSGAHPILRRHIPPNLMHRC